ncbi:MAG: glycyl-radical enzyme activating protein [Rectinemataceae bacterium]|nr:glycyl-radical enzyme activating protein [Rectinemataceae bacterium]
MDRAVVFNIARFSLHDGPGIRTVVFLKGCPLSCAWCHNPEGMSARPEVFFRPDKCLACGRCAAVCPRMATVAAIGTAPQAPTAPFPDEACPPGCQACAAACGLGVREAVGTSWDLPKLLDLVLADRVFYESSGGGVTLSGGEPLAQARFATAFLETCGRAGLHRAVETSGFAPERVFLDLAAQTDLLLFDIKLMDPAAHKAWTGVDNALILSNLRAATQVAAVKAAANVAGKEIRIRRPMIPGVNDGEDEMRALAALALELRLGVDLLPYHADAEDKYLKRRRSYRLAGMAAPEASSVAECAKLLSSLGVQVRIGG